MLDFTMVSVSRASGRSYNGHEPASMVVVVAALNIAGVSVRESLEDAKIQPVDPGQQPGEQPNGQGEDGTGRCESFRKAPRVAVLAPGMAQIPRPMWRRSTPPT